MSTEGSSAAAPEPGKRLFDEVFNAVYEELRRLASYLKRNDGSATLATTDVVSEAYLRLQNSPRLAQKDILHFKRIAARAMRQILVDAARRRRAGKRGGDQVVFVTLCNGTDAFVPGNDQLIELNFALDELAELEPRQAEILQLKYFGGLTIQETAASMTLSESTVIRDTRLAEAWLRLRLGVNR